VRAREGVVSSQKLLEDAVPCIQCDTDTPDSSVLCPTCESEVEQALVHEGGHGLMAVLRGVACLGICFDRDEGKFCALGPPPKPPEERSREDYLFSAAGVAGEKIIYGRDHDSKGAAADRIDFESSNAPSFEQILSEACEIFSAKKVILIKLKSKLMAKVGQLRFDFSSLPTIETNGKLFPMLLSKEELEAVVLQS
jgi:hypothetical protein